VWRSPRRDDHGQDDLRAGSSRGAFEIRDLTDELLEMLNVKDVQIGAEAGVA
jgi:hypothetical protein